MQGERTIPLSFSYDPLIEVQNGSTTTCAEPGLIVTSTFLKSGGWTGFFMYAFFPFSVDFQIFFRVHSYSVEFIDLLGAVRQGSQCYRIMESLSVDIIPTYQHHGRRGGECMQGQP